MLRELVMYEPGNRFAFLHGLDPAFPDSGIPPRNEDAGKLMALAAFERTAEATAGITENHRARS